MGSCSWDWKLDGNSERLVISESFAMSSMSDVSVASRDSTPKKNYLHGKRYKN